MPTEGLGARPEGRIESRGIWHASWAGQDRNNSPPILLSQEVGSVPFSNISHEYHCYDIDAEPLEPRVVRFIFDLCRTTLNAV